MGARIEERPPPARFMTAAAVAGRADLCRLLDIDEDELAWFADEQQRGRRAGAPLQHYRWRALPKRGGIRMVAAPKPRLKEAQRRLLRHVVGRIPLHPAAHGCVPGRSVASAVAPHVRARVLIRLDLESFFATISVARVRGLLVATGTPPDLAAAVAALCTTSAPLAVVRDLPPARDPGEVDARNRLRELLVSRHLPQGAPTSPALANAVAFGLDRRLAALAGRYGAVYTRYVDDLTLSGGRQALGQRHRLVDLVGAVVLDEGFRVAHRKTAVLTAGGRLHALGAVVNDHPTLARAERDRLRAIVHNCVVRGPQGQGTTRDQLLGRIAALGALDPRRAALLRADFDRIDWSDG